MRTLRNTTIFLLDSGRVIQNPRFPIKDNDIVVGPNVRRLLNVKEIMAKTGLSKNKAQVERRVHPEKYLEGI